MSSTPIRDRAPFTSPEDLATLLATLPETALLATMAAHSHTMNLTWLTTMVEGGLLDTGAQRQAMTDSDDLEDLVAHWADRIKAFTHFMTGITMTAVNASPVYGPMKDSLVLAKFDAPEEMKTIYEAASASLANDYQALIAHPLADPKILASLDEPMAQWLAGAITLDMPELVATFARDVPVCVQGVFPLQAMGIFMSASGRSLHQRDQFNSEPLSQFLSAQAAALALSRDACLEALWANGARVNDTLFVRRFKPQSDVKLGVDQLLFFMNPTCLPETWTKMLKKGFETQAFDEDEKLKIHNTALSYIDMVTHPWIQNYFHSLIDADVFSIDAQKSLRRACLRGFPNIVASLKDSIPWETESFKEMMTTGVKSMVYTDPLIYYNYPKQTIFSDVATAAAEKKGSRPQDIEQCVLNVIDMGVKAGHADLVFSTAPGKGVGTVRPETVFAFVDAKFHRVLVKFLEHGLDPHAPVKDGRSLMAYAAEHSPSTSHLIRSFEARQQALNALCEIDHGTDAARKHVP